MVLQPEIRVKDGSVTRRVRKAAIGSNSSRTSTCIRQLVSPVDAALHLVTLRLLTIGGLERSFPLLFTTSLSF